MKQMILFKQNEKQIYNVHKIMSGFKKVTMTALKMETPNTDNEE